MQSRMTRCRALQMRDDFRTRRGFPPIGAFGPDGEVTRPNRRHHQPSQQTETSRDVHPAGLSFKPPRG
jgi:hypothetical protein